MDKNNNQIKDLLGNFIKITKTELIAALIINRNNLKTELSVKSENFNDIKGVDSIGGEIISILKRIKEEHSTEGSEIWIYDSNQFRLLVFDIESETFFIAIFASDIISLERFIYSYLAADKITEIYHGKAIFLEFIPILPKDNYAIKGLKKEFGKIRKLKIASGEYAYKLILGGDKGVGKKKIISFIPSNQTDYRSTVGTSIFRREIYFKPLDTKVRFVIWDLAGQSQFKRTRQSYLSNSEAGILVYDVTRRDTYDNIKNWHREITSASKGISLILIGNKIDLIRQISPFEGEELARAIGAVCYIETSPKTLKVVEEIFKILALIINFRFLIQLDMETGKNPEKVKRKIKLEEIQKKNLPNDVQGNKITEKVEKEIKLKEIQKLKKLQNDGVGIMRDEKFDDMMDKLSFLKDTLERSENEKRFFFQNSWLIYSLCLYKGYKVKTLVDDICDIWDHNEKALKDNYVEIYDKTSAEITITYFNEGEVKKLIDIMLEFKNYLEASRGISL